MSSLVYSVDRGTWRPAPASAATRSHALACELPRERVDAGLVEAVERTARLVSRSLALDPCPRIRWLPSSIRDVTGATYPEAPGEVWIVEQERDAACRAVVHEARHCFQLAGNHLVALGLEDAAAMEADATTFALHWRPFEELKGTNGERLAHKSIRTALSIKAGGPGSFEAYASTWDTDETGERFVPGAFATSLAARRHRPLLWQHDMSLVVGTEQQLVEDAKGLRGAWAFADTAAGRDMRALVTSGAVQAMSVGFVPGQKRTARDGVTEIVSADLLECSLVSIPANPAARITSAKSMTDGRDILAELRARRRASRVPAAAR